MSDYYVTKIDSQKIMFQENGVISLPSTHHSPCFLQHFLPLSSKVFSRFVAKMLAFCFTHAVVRHCPSRRSCVCVYLRVSDPERKGCTLFLGLFWSLRQANSQSEKKFVVKCYFELHDPVLCFPLFLPLFGTRVANRAESPSLLRFVSITNFTCCCRSPLLLLTRSSLSLFAA